MEGAACAPGGIEHPQTCWECDSKVKDTSLNSLWQWPGEEAGHALSSLINSFLGQVKVTITPPTFQQHRAKQRLSNQHHEPGEANELPKNSVVLSQMPGALMKVWGCLLPFPASLLKQPPPPPWLIPPGRALLGGDFNMGWSCL